MLKHVSRHAQGGQSDNQYLSDRQNYRLTDEEPGVDVRRWLQIARRCGPMVLAIATLFALLGAIYALQLTPRYTATVSLMIDPRQQNVMNSDAVVSGIGTDSAAVDSQVALIQSANVTRRVVEKLNLHETIGRGNNSSPIATLFSMMFSSGDNGQPGFEDERIRETVRILQDNVQVFRERFSYIIDVSYTYKDPVLAARIANAFADEYLVDQLEARYEATRRANEWLESRLSELRTRVRESEQAVEMFKAGHNIVDAKGTRLTDEQITRLNEQLIEARAATAQARVKYEQLRAVLEEGGDPSSFAGPMQAQTISQLRAKASEVTRHLSEMTTRYGSKHPQVVSAQAQLAYLRQQIDDQSAGIVAAAENEYQVAQSRQNSIEQSLAALQEEFQSTNNAEIQLRELEREAEANRALFESFLTRFKQTQQQETLQLTDTRIIERAEAPEKPSEPNTTIFTLVAFVIGLGCGGGLAFILEQLDRGFRSADQVEEALGVPMLSSVPNVRDETTQASWSGVAGKLLRADIFQKLLRTGENHHAHDVEYVKIARLVLEKPLSVFTEAIRALRLGVRYANIDRPAQVVLITSALPGEGKTTIASNLAQQAAYSGERVLLLDMDLRHPRQTAIYAPDAKQGLVELIISNVPIDQVMVSDKQSGLYFIPSPRDKTLTHTAEILGAKRTRDVIEEMRTIFDLIVIDSSPLLPVTDGRVLIDAVDGVILVVQWEETTRDAVEAAIHQSHGLNEKLIGVAFNNVISEKARYYDYYKSGYYARKYPYYYDKKA